MQSLLPDPAIEYVRIAGMDVPIFAGPTQLQVALVLATGLLVGVLVYRYVVVWVLQKLAVDVAKGTLRAVLEDNDLCRLASRRWQEMMVGLNQNPDFQRTTPDAIMSDMIQDRMRGMFIKLLREEDFVKSSVDTMTDVIYHDTLQAALKDQMKQTFEDDTLHKAILKGSLEAMKPGWVKALEGQNDDGKLTPPLTRTPDAKAEDRRSCG